MKTKLFRTALAAIAGTAMIFGVNVATAHKAEALTDLEAAGIGAAAFIGGIGLGALATSPRRQPVIIQQQPVYQGLQPWSGPWYRYCAAKYRSFNPNTGYFKGYDGNYHFCR